MAEGRLPGIALKWMPKQKRERGRPKKNWMERIRKAMNERNLNKGQWEDRKQWSLGVGQRRMKFWNRHTHVHTYNHIAALSPWEQYILCLFRHTSFIQLLNLRRGGREASTAWVWGLLSGQDNAVSSLKGKCDGIKRCILLIYFVTVPDTNKLIKV